MSPSYHIVCTRCRVSPAPLPASAAPYANIATCLEAEMRRRVYYCRLVQVPSDVARATCARKKYACNPNGKSVQKASSRRFSSSTLEHHSSRSSNSSASPCTSVSSDTPAAAAAAAANRTAAASDAAAAAAATGGGGARETAGGSAGWPRSSGCCCRRVTGGSCWRCSVCSRSRTSREGCVVVRGADFS